MNQAAEKELTDLQKGKAELEASIRRLGSSAGEEEELRKKFQIKKEGEEYMVIIDQSVPISPAGEQNEKSFFEKVWSFVKDIF